MAWALGVRRRICRMGRMDVRTWLGREPASRPSLLKRPRFGGHSRTLAQPTGQRVALPAGDQQGDASAARDNRSRRRVLQPVQMAAALAGHYGVGAPLSTTAVSPVMTLPVVTVRRQQPGCGTSRTDGPIWSLWENLSELPMRSPRTTNGRPSRGSGALQRKGCCGPVISNPPPGRAASKI